MEWKGKEGNGKREKVNNWLYKIKVSLGLAYNTRSSVKK